MYIYFKPVRKSKVLFQYLLRICYCHLQPSRHFFLLLQYHKDLLLPTLLFIESREDGPATSNSTVTAFVQ